MTKPSMQYVSWSTMCRTMWLPLKCDFKRSSHSFIISPPTANEDIFSIIPARHNLSRISFSIVSCRPETYGLEDILSILILNELLECDSLMKKLGWLASFLVFHLFQNITKRIAYSVLSYCSELRKSAQRYFSWGKLEIRRCSPNVLRPAVFIAWRLARFSAPFRSTEAETDKINSEEVKLVCIISNTSKS